MPARTHFRAKMVGCKSNRKDVRGNPNLQHTHTRHRWNSPGGDGPDPFVHPGGDGRVQGDRIERSFVRKTAPDRTINLHEEVPDLDDRVVRHKTDLGPGRMEYGCTSG